MYYDINDLAPVTTVLCRYQHNSHLFSLSTKLIIVISLTFFHKIQTYSIEMDLRNSQLGNHYSLWILAQLMALAISHVT